MANNYYDATGVLVLDKVTPVITALFGEFKLDATYPGNGQAYIAKISEDNEPSWEDILESVCDLAATLGLELPDDQEGTIKDYLYLLATHYGANNEVLDNLIERNDFQDDADLGVLFGIAKCFDDGHGLNAMKIEGCWHCSKPRLFEFGGNGEYYGQQVFTAGSSTDATHLGESLDAALVAGDLDKATELLVRQTRGTLAGITNSEARESLRKQIGIRLLADAEVDAANAIACGSTQPQTTDKVAGFNRAELFMRELLDSVETLTAVADQYGSRTLADLMYLHSAILDGGFIDCYPGESKVRDIARGLPSGEQWTKFIKVEYMLLRPITHSGGVKSISDDDLCARCCHCKYRPGALSDCDLDWPGLEDEDSYVRSASSSPSSLSD